MHLDVEFSKSAMVIGIVYTDVVTETIVKRMFYKFPQTNVHFKAQLCRFLAISFAHRCSLLMHLLS